MLKDRRWRWLLASTLLLVGVWFATTVETVQETLSAQVLRLLDRANTWTAAQTFSQPVTFSSTITGFADQALNQASDVTFNSVTTSTFSVTGDIVGAGGNITGTIGWQGTAIAPAYLTFNPPEVAFASLPTPVTGLLANVSNSNTDTWGATVAGGGSFHILARYNGSVWTVVGK